MKIKILIEIRGGMVENIYTNQQGVQVAIVDHDNQDGNDVVIEETGNVIVKDEFHTLFNPNDNYEGEIYHDLKRLEF